MYNHITATRAHRIFQDNKICWESLHEVLNDKKTNRKIESITSTEKLSNLFRTSYYRYLDITKSSINNRQILCRSKALQLIRSIGTMKKTTNLNKMKGVWNNVRMCAINKNYNFSKHY